MSIGNVYNGTPDTVTSTPIKKDKQGCALHNYTFWYNYEDYKNLNEAFSLMPWVAKVSITGETTVTKGDSTIAQWLKTRSDTMKRKFAANDLYKVAIVSYEDAIYINSKVEGTFKINKKNLARITLSDEELQKFKCRCRSKKEIEELSNILKAPINMIMRIANERTKSVSAEDADTIDGYCTKKNLETIFNLDSKFPEESECNNASLENSSGKKRPSEETNQQGKTKKAKTQQLPDSGTATNSSHSVAPNPVFDFAWVSDRDPPEFDYQEEQNTPISNEAKIPPSACKIKTNTVVEQRSINWDSDFGLNAEDIIIEQGGYFNH